MNFTEKQFFRQIWLWMLLFVIMATSVVPVLNVAEAKPMVVFISIMPTFLIMALFFVMNLQTTINEKRIAIQFFPFIRKPKTFQWSDVKRAELVKYSPMSDYGGYGIRGLSDDKAYNIQGSIGLKLYFKDNTKLMIGTQDPKEMARVVSQICKQEKIPFHNSLT